MTRQNKKPVGLWGAEPSLGALHADIVRLHEALNEIMAAAQEDPRTFKGFHKRWSPQDPFKTDFSMHQGGAPGLHDPAWRPCLHHHLGGFSQFSSGVALQCCDVLAAVRSLRTARLHGLWSPGRVLHDLGRGTRRVCGQHVACSACSASHTRFFGMPSIPKLPVSMGVLRSGRQGYHQVIESESLSTSGHVQVWMQHRMASETALVPFCPTPRCSWLFTAVMTPNIVDRDLWGLVLQLACQGQGHQCGSSSMAWRVWLWSGSRTCGDWSSCA